MERALYSKHIPINRVFIDDNFWSSMQSKIRNTVIPYQFEALNDRIENAEKSYCVENFKKAKAIVEALKNGETVPTYPADKWCYDDNNAQAGAFHGWVFQDSDAYKWLEAVAYSLVGEWNQELYNQADELIDLICSAQLENGYLDTLYIINNRDEVFTNLRDFHELYCFGHLAEAAVAFYEATENDKLLKATLRFADLICDTFNENGKKGYPGHEIAELALVKLYNITGEKKYLNTAEFFINNRGQKPYYFDIEQGKETVDDNYFYNQAHVPPRQQQEAVGHAVRGVYLYTGMADVAKEKEDDELYSACKKIWDNIVNTKMYITGGIGSTVDGEAFTFDYDLPNDLAYCETCASIGLMFFARRMLEIKPDSQVADTMERALYNTVLSGMNEDGDRFFYVNPLEVLPKASHQDSRKRHIKPVRQKWFGCACCPPNLARILSSIGEYCYTENDSILFVHQYIGSTAKTGLGEITQSGNYIKNGKVEITVKPSKSFVLALRIPSWCDSYTISQNAEIKDGYAYIDISENTTINLEFELRPKLIKCSNKVRANIGKVALTYGPRVYCVEEADNGKDIQMLSIAKDTSFNIQGDNIIASGYRENPDQLLYQEYKEIEGIKQYITFIPYHKWGNRGENEMEVYIPIK